MTSTYTRERELQDEIAPAVERRLPGVEVLAVEPSLADPFLCTSTIRAASTTRSASA